MKQLKRAEANAEHFRNALEQREVSFRELQEQLKYKEREALQLQLRISRLEVNLSETNTKLKESVQLRAVKDADCSLAQQHALGLKEELLRTFKEVTLLAEEKNKAQTSMQLIRTKMAAEASRNGMLQFRVDQLTAKVRTLESQRLPTSDSSSLEGEILQVREELEQKSLSVVQLTTENSQLREEVDSLKLHVHKMEELQGKMSAVHQHLEKLRGEEGDKSREIQ